MLHLSFLNVTSRHKDVSERLKKLNPQLYIEVKHILDVNKAQRHIRGGLATRRKYRHE
jgi:putative DeoR family transcriptional regulator (stage III sporulation protein D)